MTLSTNGYESLGGITGGPCTGKTHQNRREGGREKYGCWDTSPAGDIKKSRRFHVERPR